MEFSCPPLGGARRRARAPKLALSPLPHPPHAQSTLPSVLLQEEKMPMSTYMEMQTDLNEHMRAILVDWLVEVHAKFKLRPETLYLTINVIDRFLERKLVIRQKLQLVGVAAMLIASKYEEIYAPEVRDFVYITDRAYTKEQILHMEACILNALQFRVSTPTSYVFLQRYVRVAQADRKTRYIAHYCLERCLQEFGALRFRPSLQAAAACNIALRTSRGADAWSEVMASYSGYTEAELTECIRLMERGVTEESDLQAVKKKYRSRKLEEASRSHIAALP